MNKTFKLEEVYGNMSCYSVMTVDIKDRCYLAKVVKECDEIVLFFNYFKIMYCYLNLESQARQYSVLGFFVIIVFFLMGMIAHLVDKHFAPLLKVLALKLHMNQYLAGVTLLSVGNSLPDFMANMMPIRAGSPLYMMALSSGLIGILIKGGIVIYLRPFKINGHCALRDLLFLIFACEILTYEISSHSALTQVESITLIMIYLVYLVINIVDLILMRARIRLLKKQIVMLNKTGFSNKQYTALKKKYDELSELEQDNILLVIATNVDKKSTSNSKLYWGSKQKSRQHSDPKYMPAIDEHSTRDILYNPNNPPNLFLFREFFETLIPIKIEDWKLKGWCGRLYLIYSTPIELLCTILIPIVDYTREKHGWSKLLNCIHIMMNPFINFVLAEALFSKMLHTKMIIDVNDAIWTFCITVPLAILVFFTSRTDQPPRYHKMFLLLTFCSSVVFLTICATELEALCSIIGLCFHLTEDFTSCTIVPLASAVADAILNVNLAMKGYESMAYAGVLSGPFFDLTVSIAMPLYWNAAASEHGSDAWLFGLHGDNCYIFFMLTVWTTLCWSLTFNFVSRRSAGIFSLVLFCVYILYAVLVECHVVHSFRLDSLFDPR